MGRPHWPAGPGPDRHGDLGLAALRLLRHPTWLGVTSHGHGHGPRATPAGACSESAAARRRRRGRRRRRNLNVTFQ